jgi:hypothetical protein
MASKDSSDSATSFRDRRSVPRYTFVATAELGDSARTVRLSGRVAEISRKGCYVDIQNPLPVGTALSLQIVRDQGTLVTKAKVIYFHERIGMGVAFLDLTEDQLKMLDSWIAELPPAAAL